MELLIHLIMVVALAFAATHQKDADAAQSSISYLHGVGYLKHDFGTVWRIDGFVKLIMPSGTGLNQVTFSQTQALRKVGDVWVGVEHQRYFNKNGIKGLDESVNQLMVK